MMIAEYTESADFHEFVFDNGATCKVGKQSESNPNGAANYDEAIEILKLNFEGLECKLLKKLRRFHGE